MTHHAPWNESKQPRRPNGEFGPGARPDPGDLMLPATQLPQPQFEDRPSYRLYIRPARVNTSEFDTEYELAYEMGRADADAGLGDATADRKASGWYWGDTDAYTDGYRDGWCDSRP